MKRVAQVIAWLIVLLGFRSGITAIRVFGETDRPWPVAFYLLSTGLRLAACGALTLLSIRYGSVAPGVRIVSSAANIAAAVLVLIAGAIGGEALPSAVEALILVSAAAFGLPQGDRHDTSRQH